MSAQWGNKVKLSIFGESHGLAIGINIDGLPIGVHIDMEKVNAEMARRAPGASNISTQRKEEDKIEILSGVVDGVTTGAPLCAIIKNTNQNSKDYSLLKDVMRPGHSDYPAFVKYNGLNDVRGGGTFSGRLTAPIVFAGAVAKQILLQKGIVIGSHIKSIYDIEDKDFDTQISKELLSELSMQRLPLIEKSQTEKIEQTILKAKEDGNSVGGKIECCAINMPIGLGSQFFGSVESNLSSLLFSIPAVKGVEFGKGFDICQMLGSDANDEYYFDEDKNVKCFSNNNGGVLGGLTNGMPLVFTVAIKPTPSISKEQRTVNVKTGENTMISVNGRHDPCIVPRAVPVIEAVCAISILDLL